MNPLIRDSSVSPTMECPSCGSTSIYSTSEVERFQYGDKEDATVLSASVRVHHCQGCGFAFTDRDASEIRHDAVCRHLGVLTPAEVRAVRERYSLSQAAFAELSKIGKASLARWESGVLVQNQANDNLLYLLTFSENFARLADRAGHTKAGSTNSVTNVVPFTPKLRTIGAPDIERLKRESDRFELFPTASLG